ncbi:MAG: hypothetical protein ABIU09_09785, partial [Pyrinomonadaceae bacterium]
VEAVREIHRVLKPGGVVIFNLGSAITGPGSQFLQAEFATYKAVFESRVESGESEFLLKTLDSHLSTSSVYLFKVNPARTDDQLQNLIIVAVKSSPPVGTGSDSDRPPSSPPFEGGVAGVSPKIAALLANIYSHNFPIQLPVLTDDLAPAEYYNSLALRLYREPR